MKDVHFARNNFFVFLFFFFSQINEISKIGSVPHLLKKTPCIPVHLPVVGTERHVWRIPFGAFPTHEISLQLFHCLQCLPLTGKRLHLTAWTTEQEVWDWCREERGYGRMFGVDRNGGELDRARGRQ